MSESSFISWLKQQSPRDPRIVVGIGDDLAAMKWAADDLLLVGVDQVLDGVHFDSGVHEPHQIGRKAMNRNLSDCAAMACLPAAAVVSVALPRGVGGGVGEDYAKKLHYGLRAAADVYGCPIIGGDTGSWAGKLVVSVTILGRTAGVTPITRSGAKAGDGVYVTGPLGGSMARDRHLNFKPRVELGRQLAATGRVTAMIDLSDGLSQDLPRITIASSVGAVIDAAKVPIHADAKFLAEQTDRPPLNLAMNDGEDYELLFTATGDAPMAGATRIGTVLAEPGVWLQTASAREPLKPQGWEHSL